VSNPNADFVCIGPLPGSTIPYQTYGANPTAAPPFNIFGTVSPLLTPRIHYYSVTLQRELFKDSVVTVSYVGSNGQNLLFERSLNNRPVGCFGLPKSGPCARPFDSVFQTPADGAGLVARADRAPARTVDQQFATADPHHARDPPRSVGPRRIALGAPLHGCQRRAGEVLGSGEGTVDGLVRGRLA